MQKQKTILCPSSTCKDGALLLGIVLPNQTIAYADRRLNLDSGLAAQMQKAAMSPEKRFRFAAPCAQCGCGQWKTDDTGGRCGVIEEVLATPPPDYLPRNLPQCAIREQCRWFYQRGNAACEVCRYVVTDCAVMTDAEAATLVMETA